MAKILIVDDERDMVKLLEVRLKNSGYEAIAAYDGKEGFEKAKKEQPDLIILDMMMPQVDGITMAANLKKDPETKNIPVVFLTALVDNKEVASHGSKIGGNLFFAKPFDTDGLLACIKNLIKK